jgi:hypothetical protein
MNRFQPSPPFAASFRRFAPAALLAPVLLFATIGFAQSTTSARLSGSVTDPTGAAIPHIKVTAKNTGTNLTVTVESDASGAYSFNSLPVGQYQVTTTGTGFSTLVETGITLGVSQNVTLNLPLKPGGTSDSVTVIGGADLIDTTTAELAQTVDESTIKDLPLNGRDPGTLVFLSAGVTNELNSNASTLQTTNSFPNESGASAGGQRQGSTWYLLDGISHMDTYLLLALPFPNPDATQEFRVISNNFDARNGFAPSAIVSIQTKSGSNRYHGGIFEFIRNGYFNAANPFSGFVDGLHRNQYGAYVGGYVPHFKDKLFFFANYQGTRQSYQANTNITFTPTQAERNGDFTALLAGPNPIVLPAPFVGNKIDPSQYSPGAVKMLAYIPLGQNQQTGQTNVVYPTQPTLFNEQTERLDYVINDKQRVFVRNFVNYYTQTPETTPGNILVGVAGTNGIFISDVINHTWTISPTTLNTLAFGYVGYDLTTGTPVLDASGKPICLSRFINVQDPPNECYLEDFNVNNGNVSQYTPTVGFSSFSSNPFKTKRMDYSLSETLTKTVGHHILAAGVDVFHRHHTESSLFIESPIIGFNGAYTGVPFADFLLGDAASITQGAGEQNATTQWMIGAYAQDQWKVTPKFTATLGLRWDPNTPAHVLGGRGADYVAGEQSARFPNAPLGMVYPGDPGITDQLYHSSYSYFEPRIGFAYTPNPTTAFRAAFGLFTTPMEDAFYQRVGDVAPFSPTYSLGNGTAGAVPFDNPWTNFPGGGGLAAGQSPFPPFAGPQQNPPTSSAFAGAQTIPNGFDPNLKLGVTESWNVSLEQQFGKADALHLAYVGSESYHQATTIDLNPGIQTPVGQPVGPNGNPRINSNFGQILVVQDGGTASYSALQAGIEHKFSRSFQLQSNFTWSRTTDVGGSGDPDFESSVADPYDVGHDKGPSSLNVPIVWVTYGIYKAPTFEGRNGFFKNVLGGWELSAIYTGESGEPFAIHGGDGRNRSGYDVGQDLADVVPGQPFQIRQGGKGHWLNQYFNIQSPPVNSMDAAIIKNFRFHERIGTQFRWEMFNALNHPSYGSPDNNPGDSNFGQITGIGPVSPRVIQAALKITF